MLKPRNVPHGAMEITLPRVKLEMSGLEGFADLAPDLALSEGVTLLNRLAKNPDFLDAYVLPLLEEPGETEDWYVAHRYEDGHYSYSLEVFVWPPGSRTEIHDHTSWGGLPLRRRIRIRGALRATRRRFAL